MSGKNAHIENLRTVRAKLVELRRAQTQYGVRGDVENAADHIVEIQKRLKAIDEAIADELKSEPSVYETRGISSV